MTGILILAGMLAASAGIAARPKPVPARVKSGVRR